MRIGGRGLTWKRKKTMEGIVMGVKNNYFVGSPG